MGRPGISLAIRIALFVLPIVVGWIAVRLTQGFFWTYPGRLGLAAWIIQAITVAGLFSYVGVAIAQRLAPLSALFQLTLVFPDHAPSRLGIALRSGTIKKLAADPNLTDESAQAAAEQAVALITRLGKHERLTRGHTERVRAQAELIGAEMGLTEDELQKLRWGVLLHDIGKLNVPARILNKSSELTPHEWEIMSEHPAAGARMVAPLESWLGEWVRAAGEHHERWDGAGYPNGLSGTDISLAGRITAVADAYDVITAKRSYKEALSSEAAREELVRCAGNQFDPAVVRAALQVGLREPKRVGLAGWLFEIPSVARFAAAVPAAVSTAVPAAAVSASIVAVTLAGGPPDGVGAPPTALALSTNSAEEFAETIDLTPFIVDLPEVDDPYGAEALVLEAAAAEQAEALSQAEGAADADSETAADTDTDTDTDTDAATTEPNAAATEPTTTNPTEAAEGTNTNDETVDEQAAGVAPANTTAPGSPAPTTPTAAQNTTTTTRALRPVTAADDAVPPTTQPRPSLTTTTTTTQRPATTTSTTTTTTTSTSTTTTTTTTTTTQAPPSGNPTGTGIEVVTGADIPNDLTDDSLVSETITYVVKEKQAVTLTQDLSVIEVVQGQLTRGDRGDRSVIPAGTRVCAWFVIYQPESEQDVAPVIDFGRPILGIEPEPGPGSASDLLALNGVSYDDGAIGRTDSYTITGDTLELSMSSSGRGTDQLRIITQC